MSLQPSRLSRRGFCVCTGAGLLSAGLSGCGDNAPPPAEGVDLAGGASPDLAGPSMPSSCPGPVAAGPASAIAVGQAKHLTDNNNYDLFVCRDAGGLYALTAICTHAGCTVRKQTSGFYCPCHGATFDANGQNPTSPAFSPLDHYALCVDSAGNVYVDYNTTVSATTRT